MTSGTTLQHAVRLRARAMVHVDALLAPIVRLLSRPSMRTIAPLLMVLAGLIIFVGVQVRAWPIVAAGAVSSLAAVALETGVLLCQRPKISVWLLPLLVLAIQIPLGLTFPSAADVGLFGRDVHLEVAAAEQFSTNGWPNGGEGALPSVQEYADYPLIHSLGLIYGELSGLPLINLDWGPAAVAHVLPQALLSVTTFLLFWIFYSVGRSQAMAFVATFGCATLDWHLFFHGLFVREALAFPLFLTLTGLLLRATPLTLRLWVVLLPLVAGLLFSHHLSFFYWMLLSAVFAVVGLRPTLAGRQRGIIFALSATGGIVYFTYIGLTPTQLLFESGLLLLAGLTGATNVEFLTGFVPRSAYRWESLRLSFASKAKMTALVSGAMLAALSGLRLRRSMRMRAVILMAVVLLLFRMQQRYAVEGLSVGIQRVELYLWVFLILILCTAAAQSLRTVKGFVSLPVAFVATVLLLSLSSLLYVPPYLYMDHTSSPHNEGESRMAYAESDYRAALWLGAHGEGKGIGDATASEIFGGIGGVQVDRVRAPFAAYHPESLQGYDWFIVRLEDFTLVRLTGVGGANTILTEQTWISYEGTREIHRVYASGSTITYHIP